MKNLINWIQRRHKWIDDATVKDLIQTAPTYEKCPSHLEYPSDTKAEVKKLFVVGLDKAKDFFSSLWWITFEGHSNTYSGMVMQMYHSFFPNTLFHIQILNTYRIFSLGDTVR